MCTDRCVPKATSMRNQITVRRLGAFFATRILVLMYYRAPALVMAELELNLARAWVTNSVVAIAAIVPCSVVFSRPGGQLLI